MSKCLSCFENFVRFIFYFIFVKKVIEYLFDENKECLWFQLFVYYTSFFVSLHCWRFINILNFQLNMFPR